LCDRPGRQENCTLDTTNMGTAGAADDTGADGDDNNETAYSAALAALVGKSKYQQERGIKAAAAEFDMPVRTVRGELGALEFAAWKAKLAAAQPLFTPEQIEAHKAARAAALSYKTPERSAERFIDTMFADNQPLLRWRYDYYRWVVTHWEPFGRETMRKLIYDFLKDQKVDDPDAPFDESGNLILPPFVIQPARVDAIIDAVRVKLLRPDKMEPPAWLGSSNSNVIPDTDAEYTSCRNGLLYRPTRKLVPHNPRYFNLDARTFDYDPDAKCPHWEKFLETLCPSDAESVHALREIMGYLQSGSNELQKLFLLKGPKRGGKGTIFNVNRELMGAANTVAPTLASFQNSFGLQPLIGKALAIVTDARLIGGSNTAVTETLLRISGGDDIQVNRKHKEEWNGKLGVRFMVGSNEAVRLNDPSGALASRWYPLLMEESFYGREDPKLLGWLLLELPGIFNWSLKGLDRLNARGHFIIPASAQDLARQLVELSSHVQRFVVECCEIGDRDDPAFQHDEAMIYREYCGWMEREGMKPPSKIEFIRELMAAYPRMRNPRPRLDNGSRPKLLTGIRMRRGATNKERLDAALKPALKVVGE
jgi:putative DNA primase/helicase